MFLKKIYNEKGKTFNNGLFEKCKPIKMKIYIIDNIFFYLKKEREMKEWKVIFVTMKIRKKRKEKQY